MARTVLLRKLGLPTAWLDGTVLTVRQGFAAHRCDLRRSGTVRLVPNEVGGTALEARDNASGHVRVQLLVLTGQGARLVGPEGLEALAAALPSSPAAEAREVRRRLAEQAEYLRAGAGPTGSPLRTHSNRLRASPSDPYQEPPQPER